MRRRRVLAAAVVLTVGLSLAGCTEGMNGIVGLQRLGGHVHAYVKMCDGYSVDTVRMFERHGTFVDEWALDDEISDVGTYDLGVFDDTVALIDTGNVFTIGASSTTSEDFANGPDFTSDDLSLLEDGEILTQDWRSPEILKRLDEREFAALVDDWCG